MKHGIVIQNAIVIPFPKERIVAKFRGAVLSCADCGSSFKVNPNRAGSARYCSRKCADKHRGHRQEFKRVTLMCLHCRGPYVAQACHATRRKYCSRLCASRAWSNESAGHRKSMKWAKAPGIVLHASGHLQEWSTTHSLQTATSCSTAS